MSQCGLAGLQRRIWSFSAGENPCSSHSLTCSHLCLIAPGGQRATCECPDHFIGIAVGFRIQCVADCSSTQFRCGDNERSAEASVAAFEYERGL